MKTRKLKQFDVTLAPAHWDRQANRIVSFKLGSPLPKRTVEVATIGEMFERAADFADEYGAACRLRITPVGRKLAGLAQYAACQSPEVNPFAGDPSPMIRARGMIG
jgi:hypothetical protein